MSSKIEKKDLKTIYRRYLALNCMNDYPGQMHNGYTFSLLPVLDKIYKDNKEERIKAKKRHMEYFNITPNIAGFALGISTAMEEENAKNPEFDDTTINTVKTALMGPLSAIGDTLFPATLRILATSLVITMAAAGNVFAPILFLLIYNIPNYLARWYSQWQDLFYGQRYSATVLNDQVDFVKVSEGMGAKAYRVADIESFEKALKEAIELNIPCVIECDICKDDKVFPMVAPGAPISEAFDRDDLNKKESAN